MKTMKIVFWYRIFYLGTFLEKVGELIEEKGMDKLNNLTREDPRSIRYQRKRGMIL